MISPAARALEARYTAAQIAERCVAAEADSKLFNERWCFANAEIAGLQVDSAALRRQVEGLREGVQFALNAKIMSDSVINKLEKALEGGDDG